MRMHRQGLLQEINMLRHYPEDLMLVLIAVKHTYLIYSLFDLNKQPGRLSWQTDHVFVEVDIFRL